MRVAVVGLGGVGETCAHALVASDAVRRLVLLNRTVDKADITARDLRQARAWGRRLETEIDSLDRAHMLLPGCDLIVLTLGPRLEGAEAREDVAQKTANLYRASPGLMDGLRALRAGGACVLVVTNPVEATVTYLWEATGLPPERLFGLGTTVESARLSHHLAHSLDVAPSSAWVHVIGEHGTGMFPADHGRLAAFVDPERLEKAVDRARRKAEHDAREIRRVSEDLGERAGRAAREKLAERHEGLSDSILDDVEAMVRRASTPPATRFAIAAAVVEVARAIAADAEQVMTLSSLPPEHFELPRVALALPFPVRRGGLGRCLLARLPEGLNDVADRVRATADAMGAAGL